DYVQNLRYKLQKRVRRLNSSEWRVFHYVLKQFWGFLLDQPIFSGMIQELDSKKSLVSEDVDKIINDKQALVFNTEKENTLASYSILKKCAESDDDSIERSIAFRYSNESNTNAALDSFKDLFVEPFYEYLDENLDDSGYILSLLLKYKHKCEWFGKEELYNLWSENTQKGEKLLALKFYEYLYDNGIEFYIEPSSASGEADLVSAQSSNDRLIADAKIFNPEKSKGKTYIIEGFRQIYDYTLDFNQPSGYLVIFKTSEEELKFTFANYSQQTPFVQHNSKTIFFIVIDLFQHSQPASKRGKLKSVEITEGELWKKS
ncbi:MAG TPA: hypothetical protein VFM80_07400, partial [Gracilimonas sp.]|uniref:hypothetical protein n=1 Tax=Gracilimonas sp. TaxID=1974203 RepID=UPI002DB27E49|nr:hypothetical protein [Gracilimonas sp.]